MSSSYRLRHRDDLIWWGYLTTVLCSEMDAQDEKDDAIKRVQMRLEPCTLMTQAINHRK